MKLKINRDRLADIVTRGVSSAPKNSPAVIANNARIIVKNGVLSIASTDFEMMVEASGECDMERGGSTTVDAAKLKATVDRLPKNIEVSVTIDEAKHHMIMKAGRSRVSFPTLAAEDWPARKTDINGTTFKVSGGDLNKLFTNTAHACSTAGGNTPLTGIFFHVRTVNRAKMLAAVGTTGTILVLATIAAPKGSDEMPHAEGKLPGVILSRATVDAVLRLFRGSDEVTVEVDASAVSFSTDSVRLTSSLLVGNYPDYSPLVSDASEQHIIVRREACINTVGLLETFSSKDFGYRLQCAGSDEGFVVAVGGQSGQGVDIVEADIEGQIESFGLNGQFMKTVLNAFKSESVSIHPDHTNRRVLFQNADEPELVGVVAMMNIQTHLAEEPKHEA